MELAAQKKIKRSFRHYVNLSHPDLERRKKINFNSYFTLLCVASEKAFKKPFETQQRNVKIEI